MVEEAKQFLKEVKREMKAVSWPTLDDLRGSTIVVIITVAVVAVYIWGVDIVLQWTLASTRRGLSVLLGFFG